MRNGVQAAAMRIEAAIQLGGWRGASRWSPPLLRTWPRP
jgi:hypothetical protein